jgi:hypothetical protein
MGAAPAGAGARPQTTLVLIGATGSRIVFVVIAVVLLTALFMVYRATHRIGRGAGVRTFSSELPEYVDIGSWTTPPVQMPMRLGLVSVDLAEMKYDNLMFRLPEEMHAELPSDVGTVVALKWLVKTVWSKDAASGRQWTCSVRVVDLASRKCIAEQSFAGEAPAQPDGSAPTGIVYGERPITAIVEWLLSLPRA